MTTRSPCPHCGKHMGRSLQAQRAARAKEDSARYRARASDGLCPTCGLARPVPGGKQCADCRAANAEQMRRRRAALKAMGRCQDCGKRKYSHHIMCGACSKARRERQARYRESGQ